MVGRYRCVLPHDYEPRGNDGAQASIRRKTLSNSSRHQGGNCYPENVKYVLDLYCNLLNLTQALASGFEMTGNKIGLWIRKGAMAYEFDYKFKSGSGTLMNNLSHTYSELIPQEHLCNNRKHYPTQIVNSICIFLFVFIVCVGIKKYIAISIHISAFS